LQAKHFQTDRQMHRKERARERKTETWTSSRLGQFDRWRSMLMKFRRSLS